VEAEPVVPGGHPVSLSQGGGVVGGLREIHGDEDLRNADRCQTLPFRGLVERPEADKPQRPPGQIRRSSDGDQRSPVPDPTSDPLETLLPHQPCESFRSQVGKHQHVEPSERCGGQGARPEDGHGNLMLPLQGEPGPAERVGAYRILGHQRYLRGLQPHEAGGAHGGETGIGQARILPSDLQVQGSGHPFHRLVDGLGVLPDRDHHRPR